MLLVAPIQTAFFTPKQEARLAQAAALNPLSEKVWTLPTFGGISSP
jgi:hypothetical protein